MKKIYANINIYILYLYIHIVYIYIYATGQRLSAYISLYMYVPYYTLTCMYYMGVYIYNPSAWTPNSDFMQSLLCNHCSVIIVVQSLFCSQCYTIFAMLSLLCNRCYAIFAVQSLQCNILSKKLKNHSFSLNTSYKTCIFAIFC